MVSLASLELPTGVRLEPSFEAALLRQDSVMRATYQGRNSMPFHGEHHPEAVLDQVYLEYLPRCRKAGIPIDVAALGRAAKFHDALMHVDPRLLNFPSPEHLAAVLTTNQALSEGCSKAEAERCGKIVMATHPDVRPTTPEEIIIRAADLANLAGNYQEFESATHLLHKEAQLRRGDSIAFERWLPGAYAYLRKYLYPMLELTPAARDQEGRSAWHTAVLSNISTLWAKTYQNSQCVVDVTTAECCQFPAQTPSLLYVRVHAVEEQRQRMLTELAQVCPADAAAFVVPGDVRRVPLPEACCHELILDQVDASAFNEAARVLKPHGLLRLRGSENLIALSELVLEARRAGFGYIGSDQGRHAAVLSKT